MKLFLDLTFIFVIMSLSPVTEAVTDPVCELNDQTTIAKVDLNFAPSYFAKIYPDRNLACVIANDHTYLVDIKSGKAYVAHGNYDPVPTPDGKFLTSIVRGDSMWVARTEDVLDDSGSPGPVGWRMVKYNVNYAYQSAGVLPQSPGKNRYKILIDSDAGVILTRDITITHDKTEKYFNYSESEWQSICLNIPGINKLPMLSKDGKMVSLYNVKEERTIIYNLAQDGSCTLKQALPFQTGKADFSFDGNKVAFHLDNSDFKEKAQWFRATSPQRGLNIYVWNMKTKQLTQVTNNARGNSYFPTFKKDGTLGYLSQTMNEKGEQEYAYVIANPDKGKIINSDLSCKECEKKDAVLATNTGIGALWSSVCSAVTKSNSVKAAALIPLSLDHDKCVDLVNQHWNQMRSEIAEKVKNLNNDNGTSPEALSKILAELPESAMMSACPHSNTTTKKNVPESKTAISQELATPVQLFRSSCTSCHGDSSAFGRLNFDTVDIEKNSATLRAKMFDAVEKGNMPPGGLSQDDKLKLEEFISPEKFKNRK